MEIKIAVIIPHVGYPEVMWLLTDKLTDLLRFIPVSSGVGTYAGPKSIVNTTGPKYEEL